MECIFLTNHLTVVQSCPDIHPKVGMSDYLLATMVDVTESFDPLTAPTVTDGEQVEVLIVGAGPAGSAAAYYAARRGLDTVIVDGQRFPRDKTCGDGLTPRAITQLRSLGLAEAITNRYQSRGLKLHGFGGSVTAPWPDTAFGAVGSAMPRTEFDALLLNHALGNESVRLHHAAASGVEFSDGGISTVVLDDGTRLHPKHVIVADGVRSTFGKLLGRVWHKEQVYGIAARSYCATPLSTEPWIHSHLELRDESGVIQPGYGWIFPLGNGTANVGCGALSTTARPAKINTKKLLHHYAAMTRNDWDFGQPEKVTSALLPMGGSVSNVAGKNWMLIGDAAACVNPLNGEGIDYALETAQLAVEKLAESKDYSLLWPATLRHHYGAAFVLARTAGRLLTYPKFLATLGPLGLRKPFGAVVMPAAARLMGNLVTDADRDLIAWLWRRTGESLAHRSDSAPLWGVS